MTICRDLKEFFLYLPEGKLSVEHTHPASTMSRVPLDQTHTCTHMAIKLDRCIHTLIMYDNYMHPTKKLQNSDIHLKIQEATSVHISFKI